MTVFFTHPNLCAAVLYGGLWGYIYADGVFDCKDGVVVLRLLPRSNYDSSCSVLRYQSFFIRNGGLCTPMTRGLIVLVFRFIILCRMWLWSKHMASDASRGEYMCNTYQDSNLTIFRAPVWDRVEPSPCVLVYMISEVGSSQSVTSTSVWVWPIFIRERLHNSRSRCLLQVLYYDSSNSSTLFEHLSDPTASKSSHSRPLTIQPSNGPPGPLRANFARRYSDAACLLS